MNTERNRHINSLDALKGIAILGIVLTHSGASNLSGISGEIASFGARACNSFYYIGHASVLLI